MTETALTLQETLQIVCACLRCAPKRIMAFSQFFILRKRMDNGDRRRRATLDDGGRKKGLRKLLFESAFLFLSLASPPARACLLRSEGERGREGAGPNRWIVDQTLMGFVGSDLNMWNGSLQERPNWTLFISFFILYLSIFYLFICQLISNKLFSI